MALIDTSKVADTLIEFIEEQRPVYDSLIERYYSGRRLNIFLGKRKVIPAASLPAIEVAPTGETISWHACRTLQEEPGIEIEITIDNSHPEHAFRLQTAMVHLTTRILATPPHLRPIIRGTNHALYDSLPSNTRYGTAQEGRLLLGTINWTGKQLEFLANRLFAPWMQIPPPLDFPQY